MSNLPPKTLTFADLPIGSLFVFADYVFPGASLSPLWKLTPHIYIELPNQDQDNKGMADSDAKVYGLIAETINGGRLVDTFLTMALSTDLDKITRI